MTWKHHDDIMRCNCTFYPPSEAINLFRKVDDEEEDEEEGGDDAITRQKGRPPPPSVFLRRRWWQNLGWSRGGWEPLLLLQYIIFCKGHKTLAPQASVFPWTYFGQTIASGKPRMFDQRFFGPMWPNMCLGSRYLIKCGEQMAEDSISQGGLNPALWI